MGVEYGTKAPPERVGAEVPARVRCQIASSGPDLSLDAGQGVLYSKLAMAGSAETRKEMPPVGMSQYVSFKHLSLASLGVGVRL